MFWILIIGDIDDPHVAKVCSLLKKKGENPIVLNPFKGHENSISYTYDPLSIRIKAQGNSIEIKKIKKEINLDVLESNVLQNNKPFLGICVGMQLMVKYSLEKKRTTGFGWLNETGDGFKRYSPNRQMIFLYWIRQC